jgi:hypothetical protein
MEEASMVKQNGLAPDSLRGKALDDFRRGAERAAFRLNSS